MQVILRKGVLGGFAAHCVDDNNKDIQGIVKLGFKDNDADGVNSVRTIMKLDLRQREELIKAGVTEFDAQKIYDAVFPSVAQANQQNITASEGKHMIRRILAGDAVDKAAYVDLLESLITEGKKGEPVTFDDQLKNLFPVRHFP